MIRIENRKFYQGEGVYIGRPSVLGNPYRIGEHGTREQVIAQYRVWLWEQIKQRGEVCRELSRLADEARNGDLVLICWCKQPESEVACHGEVIRSAILWLLSQEGL